MKPPLSTGFLRIGIAIAAILALVLPSAAQALPDGYAYEKVSPADKGNGEVAGGGLKSGFKADASGERVLYAADGAFLGAPAFFQFNPFFAERRQSGWDNLSTTALLPYIPATTFIGATASLPAGFSKDGSRVIMNTNQDPLTGAKTPSRVFLVDLSSREYQRIGDDPIAGDLDTVVSAGGNYPVGSDDFSAVYFVTKAMLTADATGMSPNDEKLYRYRNGEVDLVGRSPDGSPISAAAVGGGNSTTADGNVFWFRGVGLPSPLYRGEMDETTLVNEPENSITPVPLGTAAFRGADTGGSRALFESTQSLTDDSDGIGGNKLFLYEHSTNPDVDQNLTFVSVDNEPADGTGAVSIVLGVSDDARTAYFTSTNQYVAGETTSAGTKLYRWHDGTLEFLALGQFTPENYANRVSPDGRYLAFFSASAGLTSDDNDGLQQLYLYDAHEGTFECASCMPGGANQNPVVGMPNLYNAMGTTDDPRRSLSTDGRAFFVTAERLLQEDINGEDDLYTYKDGVLDLVTSGKNAGNRVRFADASADGSTVFFATREQLVAWDTDARVDLYAARLGGGQPAPPDFNPRPDEPCVGDECQDEGPAAPSGVVGGTASYVGEGNRKRVDCTGLSRRSQLTAQKAKRLKGKARSSKQRFRKAPNGTRKAKRLKRKASKQSKRAKRVTKKAKRQKRKLAECRRGS